LGDYALLDYCRLSPLRWLRQAGVLVRLVMLVCVFLQYMIINDNSRWGSIADIPVSGHRSLNCSAIWQHSCRRETDARYRIAKLHIMRKFEGIFILAATEYVESGIGGCHDGVNLRLIERCYRPNTPIKFAVWMYNCSAWAKWGQLREGVIGR